MEKHVLKWWIGALFFFNVVDAGATIFVLVKAIGTEYNPLVRFLYGLDPVVWLAVKFAVLIGGSLSLLADPQDKHNKAVFKMATFFYGGLSLYQAVILLLWYIKNGN